MFVMRQMGEFCEVENGSCEANNAQLRRRVKFALRCNKRFYTFWTYLPHGYYHSRVQRLDQSSAMEFQSPALAETALNNKAMARSFRSILFDRGRLVPLMIF